MTSYADPAAPEPRVTDPRTGAATRGPRVVDPGAGVGELADLLRGRRTVALTGAGMSTDSGIPDYRGPGKAPRTPMTYQEFTSGPAAQRRYWARSHVGWRLMGRAEPNAGHHALVDLQRQGRLGAVLTQNVDGLHESAGTEAVVALHGRVADVVCLDCRQVTPRTALQARLDEANPWVATLPLTVARPDGDAELEPEIERRYVVPPCLACGGVLKPDVVFFGENVPKDRVERCYALVERAEALLVAGSSLTVMSGLRFVRAAAKVGTPVAVVNRGRTRGHDLVDLHVEGGTSEVLTALAAAG